MCRMRLKNFDKGIQWILKDYVNLIETIRVENPNLQKYVDKLVIESVPNFWEIIEYGNTKDRNMRSAHEIRYSRFIKWLLDPTENHNLDHLFIRELLKSVEDINISNKEIFHFSLMIVQIL